MFCILLFIVTHACKFLFVFSIFYAWTCRVLILQDQLRTFLLVASALSWVQIPLPPQEERKKVVEDVEGERKQVIDAAIVRTMKSRNKLAHQTVSYHLLSSGDVSSCAFWEQGLYFTMQLVQGNCAPHLYLIWIYMWPLILHWTQRSLCLWAGMHKPKRWRSYWLSMFTVWRAPTACSTSSL